MAKYGESGVAEYESKRFSEVSVYVLDDGASEGSSRTTSVTSSPSSEPSSMKRSEVALTSEPEMIALTPQVRFSLSSFISCRGIG